MTCMCLRMWLDGTLSQHDAQLKAGTTASVGHDDDIDGSVYTL